jgi:hypothetical protein
VASYLETACESTLLKIIWNRIEEKNAEGQRREEEE